jgi:hypothetical protein
MKNGIIMYPPSAISGLSKRVEQMMHPSAPDKHEGKENS